MVSARPLVETTVQLLPLSVEYCQTPSVEESAALAVMATPRKVSLSASEKELLKRLPTVSPAWVVVSSVTAVSVGVPPATGAAKRYGQLLNVCCHI